MTVLSGTKVPSFGICAESHRKTLVVIQNRGPRRKFGRSTLRALSISILAPVSEAQSRAVCRRERRQGQCMVAAVLSEL